MSERLDIKIEVDTNSIKQIEEAIKRAEAAVKGLENTSKNSGNMMSSIFSMGALSAGALVGAVYKAADAFNEQDKAMRQTVAILKATGNASGMTAKEIMALAENMEELTQFEAEDIMGGVNTLSTFKALGSDLMPRATKAMADLATKMGGDVKGAALQLGKALADPVQGTNALKRAGIGLTLAQEQQIQKLVAMGNLQEAQKIVLGEIESRIGGMAEASNTAWDQMFKQVGNVTKAVGEVLMPTINDLINNAILPATKFILEHKAAFTALGGTLATVGLLIFGGPVAIGTAIVAVAGLIYTFRQDIKRWGLEITDFFLGLAQDFNNFSIKMRESLGLSFGKEGQERIKNDLQNLRKTVKDELAGIEKEKQQAAADAAKKEADEKKRAEAASKAAMKEAAKKAQAETRKEEIKAAEDKEKRLKEQWGDEYDGVKDLIKKKEKIDQKEKADQLKKDAVWWKKKEKLAEKYTGDDLEMAINAAQQEEQAERNSKQQQFNLEQNVGNARMEYMGQLFGNLATLQQSGSEELFRIGQAAAIAQAVVNVATGITEALKLGPIFGPPMAAALGVAGAVQIATITQQEFTPMALGGVVTGPTNALVGEAGYKEAVIPLNAHGTDVMADTMGKAMKKVGGLDSSPKNVYNTTSIMNIKLEDGTQFEAFKKKALKFQKQQEKRAKQKAKMRNY